MTQQHPTPYGPPAAYAPIAQPVPRRRRKWPAILGVSITVLVLGCLGLAALGSSDSDSTITKAAPHAATVDGIHVARRGDDPDDAGKAVVTAAGNYPVLDDAQWLAIVHNPSAHTGKGFTVDGTITQFDATTGPERMLADVAGYSATDTAHTELTLLTGTDQTLAAFGTGDEFVAQVTVVGASSYQSMIGGDSTVPHLQIASITKF